MLWNSQLISHDIASESSGTSLDLDYTPNLADGKISDAQASDAISTDYSISVAATEDESASSIVVEVETASESDRDSVHAVSTAAEYSTDFDSVDASHGVVPDDLQSNSTSDSIEDPFQDAFQESESSVEFVHSQSEPNADASYSDVNAETDVVDKVDDDGVNVREHIEFETKAELGDGPDGVLRSAEDPVSEEFDEPAVITDGGSDSSGIDDLNKATSDVAHENGDGADNVLPEQLDLSETIHDDDLAESGGSCRGLDVDDEAVQHEVTDSPDHDDAISVVRDKDAENICHNSDIVPEHADSTVHTTASVVIDGDGVEMNQTASSEEYSSALGVDESEVSRTISLSDPTMVSEDQQQTATDSTNKQVDVITNLIFSEMLQDINQGDIGYLYVCLVHF